MIVIWRSRCVMRLGRKRRAFSEMDCLRAPPGFCGLPNMPSGTEDSSGDLPAFFAERVETLEPCVSLEPLEPLEPREKRENWSEVEQWNERKVGRRVGANIVPALGEDEC